jgi:hypothetical protein
MSKCRIAAGKVYIKDLGVAAQPYLAVGNAQASLAITEETQELPDYTNPAGGNACSVRDVSGVELTLTMYDFDKKNLALAVFGTSSSPAGGAVVAEAVSAFVDGITPLAHIPTVGTVVVKNGATTYVENTDYTVTGGGFTVIAGSALATAAAGGGGTPPKIAVTVDYNYAIADVVEALTTSGKTFAMMVECRNKAADGKYEVFRLHKVQFGPTAGLPIISREFGSFEVKAELLADTTQGAGTSQFFKILQAQ